MTGLLVFRNRFADEQACIAALALVRWPDGFVRAACGGRRGYQLNARPRVFQCAGCGGQKIVILQPQSNLSLQWLARTAGGNTFIINILCDGIMISVSLLFNQSEPKSGFDRVLYGRMCG